MAIIAGIDEAGRGPLAGPVTAACVVFRPGYGNVEITDSKILSYKKREKLYGDIICNALAWSVVSVGPRRIEQMNIRVATAHAMRFAGLRVLKYLQEQRLDGPVRFLIDGNMRVDGLGDQECVVKGDSKIPEISAASILAKVSRDLLMDSFDAAYPAYGFSIHKGYPTEQHRKAVRDFGPCPIHRKTFGGVKEFIA